MASMIAAYRRYPYRIPTRVKFFNVFRYFLRFPILEEWIAQRILKGTTFWKSAVPPIYFYRPASFRMTKRNGVRMELDLSNLIDHAIFFGVPKEIGWENLLAVAKQDMVVVDIGANIGFLTLSFAKTCPQGFVYSFEPSKKNFERLKANVALNNFDNIKIFQLGLGERKEQKQMYTVNTFNTGANRILNDFPAKKTFDRISVDTLDSVIVSLNVKRVDIIKIDVEGYELFVLHGAKKTIEQYRPILFVELADENLRHHNLSSGDVAKFVEEMRYSILDASTMKPFTAAHGTIHTDVLCFPEP